MESSKERISTIIPVSPKESLDIIENSINSMRDLKVPEKFDLEFLYVIDTEDSKEDERIDFLKNEMGIKPVVREPGKGKRAGAINKGLEESRGSKYIAIFDVDSRPKKDFIEKAVQEFDKNTYIVTASRKILNENKNFVTQMVGIEYRFIDDMQNLLDSSSGFNHFNGLIGVLDGKYLNEKKLNPRRICEDIDFSERAHLEGKKAEMLTETFIGEQSVINFQDLFNQKIRWMSGAYEGIRNYFFDFLRGKISKKVKISWFLSLFTPFIGFLFSPLSIIYGLRLLKSEDRPESVLRETIALFFLSWIVSICGMISLTKNISGSEIKWKSSERENI